VAQDGRVVTLVLLGALPQRLEPWMVLRGG
jgi:hypothetical protein